MGGVGPSGVGAGVGHVHFIFFVSISFAFCSRRKPVFRWNMGLNAQCKKLVSPNARDTNMLVFLALGDAKVLFLALGDAKVPNARSFASWWNIGIPLRRKTTGVEPTWRYLYQHVGI